MLNRAWKIVPIIALIILISGIAQAFEDDFSDSSLSKWNLYGSPSPQVLGSAEGRSGVFDNNGDPNYDNGIVSKEAFSLPNGFTLESDIFMRITNPEIVWADAMFGLLRIEPATESNVQHGLLFRFSWDWDIHAQINGGFFTESGTWEAFQQDVNDNEYMNGWHKFKVAVDKDRSVKFYVDDSLIYASVNKIDPAMLEGKRLILDGRSAGSSGAGKVYHDFIKLDGIVEPEELEISKVAQVNGITVQQVNPDQIFNYNITVTNKDFTNDAPLVVITDKLPYDVEYIGAEVYPAAPADYTINQSDDLVYVRFDQIPAGSTRYINITVKAPEEAPTTLYNIVNLRYRNDPNLSDNSMTLATYVPQVGYNQTEAAKSFEDLLHNQSQLLFQFEDLLHTIPATDEENYTFLVSFEQLLRSQSDLTSSFEDLLSNQSSTGWDTEYTEENRTYLLWSYEQMLYDEAFLFASFNMKITDSWISLCDYPKDGHTQDAQTELIASFEDLLKRQTRLYKSFNLLLNKIDITDHQEMINFLAAYENLLRIEANLFMSFSHLLDTKYENPICPST